MWDNSIPEVPSIDLVVTIPLLLEEFYNSKVLAMVLLPLGEVRDYFMATLLNKCSKVCDSVMPFFSFHIVVLQYLGL